MPDEGGPSPTGGRRSEERGDPGAGAPMGDRPLRVAVIGGADAPPDDLGAAREVGELLARAGAVVVSGGGGGVMEAASRGAAETGGLTVGILPGGDPGAANPWVRIVLPTGFGQGRNVLVVQAGESVLAVGGEWGTLSEIALARKLGRDVGVLAPTSVGEGAGLVPPLALDLPTFTTAGEAVEWAVTRARAGRREDRGRPTGDAGRSPPVPGLVEREEK